MMMAIPQFADSARLGIRRFAIPLVTRHARAFARDIDAKGDFSSLLNSDSTRIRDGEPRRVPEESFGTRRQAQ